MVVKSDNSTVVSYINRQGGTRSPQLCLQTWELLRWCVTNKVTLSAVHLAGRLNIMADALSRGKVLPTEWMLHPSVVQSIFMTLERPHIDLFASALNNQLPVYCARGQDPKAWASDAFSISWENMLGYASPPISLLPRVITKIAREQCRVILIAPFWPRQPWFQRLIRLLVHPPLILPRRQDLFLQPRSQIPHPGVESLHLTSWMLSSNPLDQLAFQQTLQASQPSAAEPQRGEPITADYNISITGAGTSLLIPARHR